MAENTVGRLLGKSLRLPENVITHPVRYSMKDLSDLRESLRPHYEELNVQQAYIDPKTNRLRIHTRSDVDAYTNIAAYAPTADMLDIRKADREAYPCTLKVQVEDLRIDALPSALLDTRNGGRVINDLGGGWVSISSLSSGAVWDGGNIPSYGWISCGHGKEWLASCYYVMPGLYPPYYHEYDYDGTWMGNVVNHSLDSTVDVALILRLNMNLGASDRALDGVKFDLIGGVPANYSWVHTSGCMTGGMYSTVVNNSVDLWVGYESGPMYVYDLVQISNPTIPGDSGGSMLTLNASPEGHTSFSGHAIATDFANGYFGKIDYVRSRYNLSSIVLL